MRVATRLMLLMVGTVLLTVSSYMAVSHRQRSELLRSSIIRETEALGRVLQTGLSRALEEGGIDEARVLVDATASSATNFSSIVLDSQGRVIAGDPAAFACLASRISPAELASRGGSGWANCDRPIHWTALPLPAPAAFLIVLRPGEALSLSGRDVLRSDLPLVIVLLLAVAVGLPPILRRMLTNPLTALLGGFDGLTGEGETPRIDVPRSAGELVELSSAMERAANRLREQRRVMLRESEERLGLEKRLRHAERFAMIGRLAGGLAHEVGSPLSVIAIRAQAIQLAPESSDSIRTHAGVIVSQVQRLTDLFQGLLHMERKHGLAFDPVDLARVVRELRDELGPQARAYHVGLHFDLPQGPSMVSGQNTLLRHAIRNLVRNSLNALEDHAGERAVLVRVEEGEQEIRVIVEDTGPGIPAEYLSEVFQPFFTTRGPGKGMGLGLPVTRGIVEEHGGELFLENLDGEGLRATVVLPAAIEPATWATNLHGSCSPALPSRPLSSAAPAAPESWRSSTASADATLPLNQHDPLAPVSGRRAS